MLSVLSCAAILSSSAGGIEAAVDHHPTTLPPATTMMTNHRALVEISRRTSLLLPRRRSLPRWGLPDDDAAFSSPPPHYCARSSSAHAGRPSSFPSRPPQLTTAVRRGDRLTMMPDGRRRSRRAVVRAAADAFRTSSSLTNDHHDDDDAAGGGSEAAAMLLDGLNQSQREAVLRPRYSITRVVAGPGAGKTKVLTCRIASLLLPLGGGDRHRGRKEEGILAVTFTKKSAGEMERRLTELLKSSIASSSSSPSDDDDDDDARPSAIFTGDGYDPEEEEEMMMTGDIVRHGNAYPDDDSRRDDDDGDHTRELMVRTTVGTFHSVCSKILRKFGRELGNLSSVRGCLGVTTSPSGATVTSMGDEHNNNVVTVQTLDGSFNILDQSDQLRLLKEILQRHNIELKSTSPFAGGGGANNNEIRPITVLNAISSLNTRDATGGDTHDGDDVAAKMSKRVHKIATEIRVPFQRAKYSQNSVDFDDLILLTRELLLHHPEVREILHRRWRHVLVDEFQDTSRVQLDLVRLLTTNSLFVVGDGDQSIYSWRGASPESMSEFEVAFHDRAHGWEELLGDDQEDVSKYLERIDGVGKRREVAPLQVKSVYLMENYRSTTNIVRAAQRIISTNSEKSDGANPTLSAQDEIRRDMKPMRGDGPSPRVLACKDGKAEAKFVVQTVKSMVDGGDLTPSSTVAIIYRTNAQSRLLEEACVEDNLRYVVRGSSGTFYKRAEIQDCMSFLKIMYNPRDRSAWARAVKAPSRGIGETSLNEFFRYCDAVTEKYAELGRNDLPSPLDVMISFAPAVGASPTDISPIVPPKDIVSTRSMNRFVPFASSLRSLRRKGEAQTVSDFLLSVIDDLGLKSHFDAISKTRDEYEDRLGNVMELVRAAERYKTDGPCISFSSVDEPMETPLGNFLDDVALIADIAPDELDSEDGGRIVANLMTIHSSKGMEFDAVFLVGNEEGTFPTQRSIAEGERSIELSEERRLCYVAMTRAKTHLVLTWRREVLFFSGATFKSKDAVRSRFLDVLVSKQGAVPGKGGSNPSTQARSNNLSLKNGTSKSGVVGSMTKREMHTEAKRLLASEGKSWGSWDPSSQKKTIRQIPSIELKSPANGVDQRPKLILDQTRILSVDRRKVMTSPQSQTAQQSMDMRQMHQSSRNTSINVNAPKKQSQTVARRSDVNQATLRGEPPPDDMDSTLFFPVGSSVKHKLHGRGVVQTPPNSDSDFSKKMLVRVKFIEESTEWDLPMDGLVHAYD